MPNEIRDKVTLSDEMNKRVMENFYENIADINETSFLGFCNEWGDLKEDGNLVKFGNDEVSSWHDKGELESTYKELLYLHL